VRCGARILLMHAGLLHPAPVPQLGDAGPAHQRLAVRLRSPARSCAVLRGKRDGSSTPWACQGSALRDEPAPWSVIKHNECRSARVWVVCHFHVTMLVIHACCGAWCRDEPLQPPRWTRARHGIKAMHWESVRARVQSLWATGVMQLPCKNTSCCALCFNQGTGITTRTLLFLGA